MPATPPKKRIIICADGTWNRPEADLRKDFPTNVLKIARAIAPVAADGVPQVVFYDWGVGSYYDSVKGGAFGQGINKNIQDGYRFLVQNYDPGDELFLFGFSRGAYTVRSLSGLLYNCGVLHRKHANRIGPAFELYKDRDIHPDDPESADFRRKYAVEPEPRVRFVGVWDTVGSLGIPLRMLGFLNDKHLFHDEKIGPNVDCARHALALDERRDDFRPTIWKRRRGLDLKQVWFAGVHSDVVGGYKPGKRGASLSDLPLEWMAREATGRGLGFEPHLASRLRPDPLAEQHEEYAGFYRVLGDHRRPIPRRTLLHESVRRRYRARRSYRPPKLVRYLEKYGWDRVES